jgi:hypothetical protein
MKILIKVSTDSSKHGNTRLLDEIGSGFPQLSEKSCRSQSQLRLVFAIFSFLQMDVCRWVRRCLVALALISCHEHAVAWSSAGHEIIAAEAWRELPKETKAKVTEILKAHPEYSNWQDSFRGESSSVDLAAYVFMRAAVWPDQIRRHGSKWDHPAWHFIDYPLRPSSFPMDPGPSPTNDIVFGIAQCEKVLRDPSASAEEHAVHLSWLLHLAGDIHEPLHCASLLANSYPNGDKGGNAFFVKPGTKGISLHSFWDRLLGTSGSEQSHFNRAVSFQKDWPRHMFKELGGNGPKEWSLESRTLAVDKVYLRGQLKESTDPETAPGLPEGYAKSAKSIAEWQCTLAGYRLTDQVTHLIK